MWWLCASSSFFSSSSSELLRRLRIVEEEEERETGRRRCPKHCRAKEEEEEEEELLEKTRRNDDDDGDGVVVMIFLFERQKRAFFCKVAHRASFGDQKKFCSPATQHARRSGTMCACVGLDSFLSLILIFYYTHNIQKIKPLFPVDESISINRSINQSIVDLVYGDGRD